MRRYVRKFNSSDYINALANGDICLAVARSGEAYQARERASEASSGVDIAYAIPQEGTVISLDALAIPKDAPHPAAALALIDFLMRPKIAAENTKATHFANGVIASKPFVAPDILTDKGIYPDAQTMQRLFTVTPYDQRMQKFVAREWTFVKTGK
jgi:putrescine transport system substrate-binding protein